MRGCRGWVLGRKHILWLVWLAWSAIGLVWLIVGGFKGVVLGWIWGGTMGGGSGLDEFLLEVRSLGVWGIVGITGV